jgi:hypothetical protein
MRTIDDHRSVNFNETVPILLFEALGALNIKSLLSPPPPPHTHFPSSSHCSPFTLLLLTPSCLTRCFSASLQRHALSSYMTKQSTCKMIHSGFSAFGISRPPSNCSIIPHSASHRLKPHTIHMHALSTQVQHAKRQLVKEPNGPDTFASTTSTIAAATANNGCRKQPKTQKLLLQTTEGTYVGLYT